MLQTVHPARQLRWDACYNARDLGGYPTSDGGQTRWGALVRTDNLARLTSAGRAALIRFGVRTIVDLRSTWELDVDPPPFTAETGTGVVYCNIPLLDERDSEAEARFALLRSECETKEEAYIAILEVFIRQVGEVIRTIARADEGGVLFHCHSGQDRTGLIAALLLELAGVDDATIAEDYALTESFLRPTHDGTPGEHTDAEIAEWHTTPPEVMLAVLAHLRAAYGGIQGYLHLAGVSDGEIDQLRARLVA